jgi:hypothetical protein
VFVDKNFQNKLKELEEKLQVSDNSIFVDENKDKKFDE